MDSQVSIIIPTHNRHNYLKRVLEYYRLSDIPVYVVDSSVLEFNCSSEKYNTDKLQYFHLPQKSLTGKIAHALEIITTPFVVMCADDDFIIPAAIFDCVDFLNKNLSFSLAMGNAICYKMNEKSPGKIDLFALYTDRLSFETTEEDATKRLEFFFNPYRTVFYAVHRTQILKKAFEGAEKVITNLFLNEYITAIYPVVKGHIAQLPLLYHIREYAENSGDKTIDNIDSILLDHDFKKGYELFLDYQALQIAPVVGKSVDHTKTSLATIFLQFANHIYNLKHHSKVGADKKIGKFVQYIPFIGGAVIAVYRKQKSAKALAKFVKTEKDKKQLEMIIDLINKYKGTI